ncbi:hypothetical protein LTR10_020772 [Elasticomyces elasticus]|uniref:G domain-containing protein n=1 Tax=Exophiala sideris TaxID=1016849 RepID=A0ABR0J6V2_9EURO|nr:hypothetical protein LTR10_020772 [Elasticomyces elasticus]KAK5028843.1 hypothetical protein LTS07_006223 [Exophiala sideris]KAK5035712.1 hypothetical protein LTR13_005842 [Exophiala sideris]KAK5057347.1 hypothetical protein LTR69_007387 [Exophiala sideris]KAK5181679.1 hypothetical protein LTR44_005878 [Eurotiomycetes sp. CCFEE 6388]
MTDMEQVLRGLTYLLITITGTSSISIFSFKRGSTSVHLIDTPGFNDSTRSESEVLQEISYWLSAAYGEAGAQSESRFRLDGIVYLHSIADPRWSGATRRSFDILRNLCGPENNACIVLTTTFWNQVDKATGRHREDLLLNGKDKWHQLLQNEPKSVVRRHDQGYKSAMSIIDFVVKRGVKYELLIQKELAKAGVKLYDTTAGREARNLWEGDIERFQKELSLAKEAFDVSRQDSDNSLTKDMANFRSSITERETALKDLLLSKEELEDRWVTRNNRDVELLQRKILDCHNVIDSLLKRCESSLTQEDGTAAHAGNRAISSHSDESSLLAEERRRQKALMAQKMAKIAARSMHIGVASALCSGVSAGVAVLPLLPFLMCRVM